MQTLSEFGNDTELTSAAEGAEGRDTNPEAPWQTWEVIQWETHEVQQRQVHLVLHLG